MSRPNIYYYRKRWSLLPPCPMVNHRCPGYDHKTYMDTVLTRKPWKPSMGRLRVIFMRQRR